MLHGLGLTTGASSLVVINTPLIVAAPATRSMTVTFESSRGQLHSAKKRAKGAGCSVVWKLRMQWVSLNLPSGRNMMNNPFHALLPLSAEHV